MRLHKCRESFPVVLLGGLLFGLGTLMFTNVLLLFAAGVFWLLAVSGCFIYLSNRLYLEVVSNKFGILFMESIKKD